MNRLTVRNMVTAGHVLGSAAHVKGFLLDVGCGNGWAKQVLKGHYSQYVGLDITPIGDMEADAHAIPLADATFDTVLCVGTLNYCKAPLMVLSECARVLKPGGKLIVSAYDSVADDGELYFGICERFLGESLTELDLDIITIGRHGNLMKEEVANMTNSIPGNISLPEAFPGWVAGMDDHYPSVVSAIAQKKE